ncbi:TPA: NTF2 fold immunity protein [Escherichia coli]
MYTGKKKQNFQKPYSITDDNNCWKIEGKQPKTLGGNFTILIAKKMGKC